MDDLREWLAADGCGGFASGTVSGVRTRRYHALLLAARRPPAQRFVLVNGFDARVTTGEGTFAISSQRYEPGVTTPDGAARIESFEAAPWPRWVYRAGAARVEQTIVVARGAAAVRWKLLAGGPAAIEVRPFFSGRDFHALHRENPAFRFDPEGLVWRPYEGVPSIEVRTALAYRHDPQWYRRFLYEAERERGLDGVEDLASPGVFRGALPAEIVFAADGAAWTEPAARAAADAYVVERGAGLSVIAGYPWFGDWGRDTAVAVRGLCLARRRFDDARRILLTWAEALDGGMVPNRFPDGGGPPEFNAADASLWFAVAAGEFLAKAPAVDGADRRALQAAIDAVLAAYQRGTRFGIRADADGLLRAGEPGQQLTWMDARVAGREVTPRIGKPVELQALWAAALAFGSARREFPRAAFVAKFWSEKRGFLLDVADPDDPAFRPNQIFAVGGLPRALLDGPAARRVVDAVERRLWTPRGLRTLAQDEPGYRGHCEGDAASRDGAYHQGTAWPWLAGAFVEAWVRVRGGTAAAKKEARARFVAPLRRACDEGFGHLPEIADGDAPHRWRGCPFQAWSLAELIRLEEEVVREA